MVEHLVANENVARSNRVTRLLFLLGRLGKRATLDFTNVQLRSFCFRRVLGQVSLWCVLERTYFLF